MKKIILTMVLTMVMTTSLVGCGSADPDELLKIDYDLVAVDKDGNEVILPATIEDVDVKKIQFVDIDEVGKKDSKKVTINVSDLLK